MKLIPALLAAALLAGCSTPSVGVTLKASCDALGLVVAEFGQVAPTAERYTEFLPRLQAIHDAGDADTKAAVQPVVAAWTKGAAGDAAAMVEWAAASVDLAGKCAAAGSTAYA